MAESRETLPFVPVRLAAHDHSDDDLAGLEIVDPHPVAHLDPARGFRVRGVRRPANRAELAADKAQRPPSVGWNANGLLHFAQEAANNLASRHGTAPRPESLGRKAPVSVVPLGFSKSLARLYGVE